MSGETVEAVAYDPAWPQAFAAEREALLAAISPPLLTAAKTAFIQELVDRARAVRGLPPVDVWGAA